MTERDWSLEIVTLIFSFIAVLISPGPPMLPAPVAQRFVLKCRSRVRGSRDEPEKRNRNPERKRFAGVRLKLWLVCVLLSCVALMGCIVAPIPMTKRVEVPGPATLRKAPDLAFVHAGETDREEVLQKLSGVDTGYASEDLFFGRWVSSGSGWIWFIAGDDTGAGGYWRNWKVHNVFVTFGLDGRVKDLRDVNDQRLVETTAKLLCTQSCNNDLSITVQLRAHHEFGGRTGLVLKGNSLVFDHPDPPKIYFHVAPQQISGLRLIREHHPDPKSLQIQMSFRQKTAMGRRVLFMIAPSDLLRLTEYLQTVNPAALQ